MVIYEELISVIIPIYNAQKSLCKCIDSVLAQSFENFELILIDDGSTDNSNVICDDYALKDKRVRLFHKENGGVSSARNLGLDKAIGKWIVFVDSDDWCEPQYLEILHNNIKNTDFVVSSYSVDGNLDPWDIPLKDNCYNAESIYRCLNLNLENISFMVPWSKMFRHDLIENNKIRFNTRISQGEDSLFILNYLQYVSTIRTLSDTSYHQYRGNTFCESGKVYSYQIYIYTIECIIQALKKLEERFPKWNVKQAIITFISGYFRRILLAIRKNEANFLHKRKALKYVVNNKDISIFINDSLYYPKGKKRKFIDFLCKNKYYTLLVLLFFYLDIDY